MLQFSIPFPYPTRYSVCGFIRATFAYRIVIFPCTVKPVKDGDDRAVGASFLSRGNIRHWIKAGQTNTSRHKSGKKQHRSESTTYWGRESRQIFLLGPLVVREEHFKGCT